MAEYITSEEDDMENAWQVYATTYGISSHSIAGSYIKDAFVAGYNARSNRGA